MSLSDIGQENLERKRQKDLEKETAKKLERWLSDNEINTIKEHFYDSGHGFSGHGCGPNYDSDIPEERHDFANFVSCLAACAGHKTTKQVMRDSLERLGMQEVLKNDFVSVVFFIAENK